MGNGFSNSGKLFAGVINLFKPSGMTSRDAVNRIGRLLPNKSKVGHAGTLDPAAEGVLVICVGKATRLITYVQATHKRYVATLTLGVSSDTDDAEGQVTNTGWTTPIERTRFEDATLRYVGEIEQIPPQYSAVHIDGKRAYSLARQGKTVEIKARSVRISSIACSHYDYPTSVLDIECGSGTYIRSIARDIGNDLQCGAILQHLLRTEVGSFTHETAVRLDQLTAENIEDHILPPLCAVDHMRQLTIDQEARDEIAQGRFIRIGTKDQTESAQVVIPDNDLLCEKEVALIDESDQLVAIAQINRKRMEVRPKLVLI